MKLKRLVHYCLFPALVWMLAGALHAQNTLTVSSFTIFLNGVTGG